MAVSYLDDEFPRRSILLLNGGTQLIESTNHVGKEVLQLDDELLHRFLLLRVRVDVLHRHHVLIHLL